MEPLETVKQIGKYEILSELGRGGMAVVLLAKDTKIGREVAIKMPLSPTTPEARRRFEEAEAQSGRLNHLNIVTIYDSGEQDGTPYIVMDYIRGESLERMLKSGQSLPLFRKIDIVRQTLDGLGYAHTEGFVHRDIKPANIMVQPDGNIKIVDFGIAREEKSSGHTRTGDVIGTIEYISPERLCGEPCDGRADIWSVGVMLYRLLTSRLPFPSDDSSLYKIVHQPHEPISKFLSGYPSALDEVIDRALAKKPSERYSSAEEMASDLESINEELKLSRVDEVLLQVKALLEENNPTRARPMLWELKRLVPKNTEVKRLLQNVEEQLTREQRIEERQRLLRQADDAEQARRYGDAIEAVRNAIGIDPGNHGLTNRLEALRGQKDRADRVDTLKSHAREARDRSDFHAAAKFIGEAIGIDATNTDLRNEQARILQEQDRLVKDKSFRKLVAAGREYMAGRQFTEAIKVLGEALPLNPTDSAAQQMYQEAVAKQEDDRRRKIIDQIIIDIQDQIFRGQLERALGSIQRALEQLPGEPALLRLKAETQRRFEETAAQKLVEETSIKVQSLFYSAPQEALAVVQQALGKMPGEARLLELQQGVVDRLKAVNLEALRAQYLKQGQTAVDAGNLTEAIRVLETTLLDCGDSAEVRSLLEFAGEKKLSSERRVAVAKVVEDAQRLIDAGELQPAIAMLERAYRELPDPAIEGLLARTQSRYADIGRSVQAVIDRIREVAERDPANALALLQSQPQAIQQHPEMKSLRQRLDTRGEQQRVTAEAMERSANLMNEGKLRDGLQTLEAVRQAYGDLPQILNAIAEYKAKRAPLAVSVLTKAISEARQALLAREASRAVEVLKKARFAVEFVDPAMQVDYNRLAKEVTDAAKIKPEELQTGAGSRVSPKLVVVAVTAVIVAALAAVWLLKPTPPPLPPTVQQSYMTLDASPYATVVSITAEKGTAIPLPNGDETTTPLRLDMPVGKYKVVFRSSEGTSITSDCEISTDSHACQADPLNLNDDQVEAIEKSGANE